MAANTAPPQKAGLLADLASYPSTFWFANGMEMLERWAYYGVRLVLALYIVGAVADGGLGFTHIQKGNIYLWWAIISSFLPMFTGGYADAYGYKKTIAIAVVLKVFGYGLMATQREFMPFFMGCMLLAAGTGLFKPGVQGLIAHAVIGRNASVGWGVFYELVNVGAFVAGLTLTPARDGTWAAYLGMAPVATAGHPVNTWWMVFAFNTALVAVNFLPLLMFKEPDIPRPPRPAGFGELMTQVSAIFVSSIRDLMQPRLLWFILIFSGFWFSFHQLFDLLPNFIDDWVNVATLPITHINLYPFCWLWPGTEATNPFIMRFTTASGAIAPEGILNINSFLIMLAMIPVAYVASWFRPLVAICGGIALSLVGILLAGFSTMGTYCLLGITVFTVGEMLASPRTQAYLGGIAPPDKKGLFLGYAQVPSGIGWGLGSLFAGHFYEDHGDKTNFARQYLTEHGMTAQAVKEIPKEKVLPTLADQLHTTPQGATDLLWTMYHPAAVWYWIAGVGVVSLFGMLIYNALIERMQPDSMEANVPAADGVPAALAKAEHDVTQQD